MFETTVGTHRLDRDDVEPTQQFPPIFQALLRGALGSADGEDDFHRDPLAAPLPTQLSSSPAETALPSTLDAALLTAAPSSSRSAAGPTRSRLRAVPTAGGAHRAEAHTGSPVGRRAARAGAHRAPEGEPQRPDQAGDRPATSRGGRHRTLRAVAH